MNMRMVLIPGWLEEALQAAKAPLDTVLDTARLSSILSKEDVAFYIDSNNRLYNVLFPQVAESVNSLDLYPYKSDAIGEEKLVELQNFLSRRLMDIQLEQPQLHQAIQHLPFEPPSDGQNQLGNIREDYVFEVSYLKDDILALRPKLINRDENPVLQLKRSYDQLFKVLTAHISFESIALSPAFRFYAKLLELIPAS